MGGGGRGWHTDCVERPVARALRGLGGVVGAHPWPFLLLPMVISALLGVGFTQLPLRKSNDIEAQFTPRGGPAKAERSVAQERFPTDDATNFSAPRLSTEGAFASFVVVAAEPSHTLLTRAAFAELLELDTAVRGIQSYGRTFDQVCARSEGSCSSPNLLFSAVSSVPARIELLLPSLTFPVWHGHFFLGVFLGGVTVDPGPPDDRSRPLRAAKALRLFYYLQEDDPAQREASLEWLKAFLQQIPDALDGLHLSSMRVSRRNTRYRAPCGACDLPESPSCNGTYCTCLVSLHCGWFRIPRCGGESM